MDDARTKVPVSIIIPVFIRNNDEDIAWLREALESAIDQTVRADIVIVENGSDYLPDLLQDGSNLIRIIHSEKGLSKARNAGIRFIETEFFFPLDGNDWLPSKAIEIVYSKRPATGFVYGSTMLFSGARGMGDQVFYEAKPYDFHEVMKFVYFPNGALQRKADWEKAGGYREDLPFLEDWDYWMTCGERGICGTAIPETIYWYRQHGGLVGSNKHSSEWERIKRLIQGFHRNIYKGAYPPMCCGNKTNAKSKASVPYVPPAAQVLVPGEDGMILIEYTGGNAGDMTWYGAVTNHRYTFGGIHKQGWIDPADAITGKRKQPGFLEIVEHGVALFKQITPEPA